MKIVSILENIRSLYNVGSIFRTADGAGIDKIYLTGITGFPPRKEISKVALGAEKNIEWEYQPDALILINQLKKEGWKIISIEKNAESELFWKSHLVNKTAKICLVFGNEVEGITSEVLAKSDAILHLPMSGLKESLNVSVCAGIVFYEILRQK